MYCAFEELTVVDHPMCKLIKNIVYCINSFHFMKTLKEKNFSNIKFAFILLFSINIGKFKESNIQNDLAYWQNNKILITCLALQFS
jgi:hypothetical protein